VCFVTTEDGPVNRQQKGKSIYPRKLSTRAKGQGGWQWYGVRHCPLFKSAPLELSTLKDGREVKDAPPLLEKMSSIHPETGEARTWANPEGNPAADLVEV